MTDPDADATDAVVAALLARHGETFCEELGIDIAANTPSALFRWLTAALLYSARIAADQATRAARALAEAGLTTAAAMAEAGWQRRVEILNAHGYARFDERTARMLGETAETLLADYGGDLRRLRSAAGREPAAERARLKAFKGIGDVGVDIFFREAQAAWAELFPFVDRKTAEAAGKLGLPRDAAALARLVPDAEYPVLVAALTRTALAGDHEAILGR